MISDRAQPLVPSAQETMLQKYHFSPALRVDQTVYVSGQIGVGEDGLPLLDAEAQFVAAFESLADLLALGGCGFEDVVDVMSFHTSFDQFDLFIAVRDRYLLGPVFPCWTAVGAELGLAGALVEVKCVAVRKSINGSV